MFCGAMSRDLDGHNLRLNLPVYCFEKWYYEANKRFVDELECYIILQIVNIFVSEIYRAPQNLMKVQKPK
jgi:hypothetical protein